jgi:hypothetical protein
MLDMYTTFRNISPNLQMFNDIGGVMVSILASSAVDRWFDSRSG